jgi:hypothetical protein
MNDRTRNIIRAMLDGVTFAGLFGRLRYPGAPKYVIDPRPVDEILASGSPGEDLKELLERRAKLSS